MKDFIPDYRNVVNAAKNKKIDRIPLYEHIISERIMEQILDKKFSDMYNGGFEEKKEYFKIYVEFFKTMGYDTISFERCIGSVMPGSGALGGHKPGVIKTREDFEKYSWEYIPQSYFDTYDEDFLILRQVLPQGMKLIGGPGNGVFELVQDIVGYTNLCYISYDDPQLYKDLFIKVSDIMYKIWDIFLNKYADLFAVCRFGDDLGFKTSTLTSAEDIKNYIIPQYKKIVNLIHSYNKPFLLHSCGNIFAVMDDLINIVKIDAKHSNEDQIAPFAIWVDNYGDKIGNFGGVDTDILCRYSEYEIKKYVNEVMEYTIKRKSNRGFALGSGNSIPDYVPVSGYLAMIEAVREFRGE